MGESWNEHDARNDQAGNRQGGNYFRRKAATALAVPTWRYGNLLPNTFSGNRYRLIGTAELTFIAHIVFVVTHSPSLKSSRTLFNARCIATRTAASDIPITRAMSA